MFEIRLMYKSQTSIQTPRKVWNNFSWSRANKKYTIKRYLQGAPNLALILGSVSRVPSGTWPTLNWTDPNKLNSTYVWGIASTQVWTYVCMYVCMYLGKYVCMYVCKWFLIWNEKYFLRFTIMLLWYAHDFLFGIAIAIASFDPSSLPSLPFSAFFSANSIMCRWHRTPSWNDALHQVFTFLHHILFASMALFLCWSSFLCEFCTFI